MISIKWLPWIAGVMLAVAAFFFVRELSFLSGTETANGKVTALMVKSSSSSGGSLCPVIEFTTQAGQTSQFTGNVCINPPFWRPGDSVEVVYDPQDLEHVQMKNILAQYLLTLIFGIFGGVCLALWIWLKPPAQKK